MDNSKKCSYQMMKTPLVLTPRISDVYKDSLYVDLTQKITRPRDGK